MIFMYAINSMTFGWWENTTLVVWGGSTKLVSENQQIQQHIKAALDSGIYVTSCKSCSEKVGATEKLQTIGIDVQYLDVPLTNVLKIGKNL
jgi:hypothetical protein